MMEEAYYEVDRAINNIFDYTGDLYLDDLVQKNKLKDNEIQELYDYITTKLDTRIKNRIKELKLFNLDFVTGYFDVRSGK
jgi:hypothetical protein